MLLIRNRIFESNDSAEIAFSKLDWKVEKVKRLTNALLNNSTTDTIRPWVGKIDRNKRKFEIIQTAPYFSPRILEFNFFQLFVHGKITDEGRGSKIILKFRLGLTTLFFFILMYLLPIFITSVQVKTNNGEWGGLLFGLLMPILFTLLLLMQLNKTENKLIDLFGEG